jgi:alkylated DNA repair protein alkB family protein 6
MSDSAASKPNATTASLDGYLVKSMPNAVHYISNFISPVEESQLLQEIHSQPKPKWTVLSHRRLQTHPYALTASNVLLAAPLPAWLSSLVPRMQALGIWDLSPHAAPNHVLINEYNPGEGIMPHEDGGAYYGCVATVSLGAPIVLDIYEKAEGATRLPKWRILQEPRRLVASIGTPG